MIPKKRNVFDRIINIKRVQKTVLIKKIILFFTIYFPRHYYYSPRRTVRVSMSRIWCIYTVYKYNTPRRSRRIIHSVWSDILKIFYAHAYIISKCTFCILLLHRTVRFSTRKGGKNFPNVMRASVAWWLSGR